MIYTLLTAFSAACVWLYASYYGSVYYAYSSDSAQYIMAARSLLQGHPLLTPPVFGFGVIAPIKLWPPGYPVLIAAVGLLGVEPAIGSLWIAQLTLVALAPGIFWALRRETGDLIAAFAAAVAVTAPGMLPMAQLAQSDTLFALLAVVSIGTLFRGLRSSSNWTIALAGCLVGISLLVRNAAIALGAAHFVTLSVDYLRLQKRFSHAVRGILVWLLGAALPVFALIAWNLLGVGSALPYDMPPSSIGLLECVRAAAVAIFYDFLPFYSVAQRVVPLYWIGILVYVVLVVWLLWRALVRKRDSDAAAARLTVFAVVYVTLGIAMVVIARARYEWGGTIGYQGGGIFFTRLLSQYDWLFLVVVVAAVVLEFGTRLRIAVIVLCALFILGARGYLFIDAFHDVAASSQSVALAISQVAPPASATRGRVRQYRLDYSVLPALSEFVRDLPPTCSMVTNLDDVMNISMRRTAFNLDDDAFAVPALLHRDLGTGGGPDVIVVGVTPAVLSEGPAWRDRIISILGSEFPDYVAFRRSGPFIAFARDKRCVVP